MPAVLPTGLPSCRPAFRRACRPAFLPTSLPACLPASCLDARCFILSRSYLPSCRTTSSILFSLSVCRHADGCGHALSHFLDLPACLPAGLPFFNIRYLFFFADMPSCRWLRPCLLLSSGPACLPACRIAFSTLDISFSLPICRHADGRGHFFSHLLDLPACLPAGLP